MKVSKTVKPLNDENPTLKDDYLSTVSCNDCTGLIPTPAQNNYEAESYEELVNYLPPVASLPGLGVPGEPILKSESLPSEFIAKKKV